MRTFSTSIMCITALLMAGCADQLTTDYGVTSQQRESINGLVLFESALAERVNLQRRGRLSPNILADDEIDAIFYIDRYGDDPEPEAIKELVSWLYAESGRSLYLFLRDGTSSAALCRHWMREIEQEKAGRDPTEDAAMLKALSAQHDTYAQRLAEEQITDNIYRSNIEEWSGTFPATSFLHDEQGVPRLNKLSLSMPSERLDDPAYPLPTRAVWTDWATVSLPILNPSFALEGGEPMVQVLDEQQDAWHNIAVSYAADSMWGDPGRLVMWTTAQPLLDGVMPSIAHRQLMEGMVDELVRFHTPNAYDDNINVLWLREVGYSDSNSEEQFNMLSLVFTQMPLALFSWHLLALLVIYLLWKNRWLGRRGDLLDPSHQQFRQHMLSLSQHMSRRDDVQTAASAIADYRRIPHGPKRADVYDALHYLNQKTRKDPIANPPYVPQQADAEQENQ